MATAKEETDERTVTVPGAQLAATAVSLLDQSGDIPEARPKADPLHRLVGWLRTRIRYWSTLRALERLDDRMLADLDMERTNLTGIAWRLSRPSQ